MSLITLSNSNMPLVEYQGQRVVTFAMIDEAHQRPKDTAKKAFQRNRNRFIEGKDYFVVNAGDVNWLAGGIKRPGKKITNHVRGMVTLFNEYGYLLLTKPFSDDLSWQVQRTLVDGYFRPIIEFRDIRPITVPTIEELEVMPPMEAANLIAQIEHQSKRQHGQHGSAEMTQRRRELKLIRPAIAHVQGLIQMVIPGLEVKP